jgi:hypothetical protein
VPLTAAKTEPTGESGLGGVSSASEAETGTTAKVKQNAAA